MRVVLVVLSVLAATACGDDGGGGDGARTVEARSGEITEARVGDTIEIALSENPSVGDAWQVTTGPDPTVARVVGDSYESSNPDPEITGAGGTRVFVLEAVGTGETRVEIHNCYRCDDEGNTPPEDTHEAVDLVYDLIVTASAG